VDLVDLVDKVECSLLLTASTPSTKSTPSTEHCRALPTPFHPTALEAQDNVSWLPPRI
jgi:hypothetical protein